MDLLSQADFGGDGITHNFTIPANTTLIKIWGQGPGAGGGAGNSNSAGGGGGSGVKGYWCIQGTLASKALQILCPAGGGAGIAPGGNGTSASGHTTITWDNGWQLIFGKGGPGYGGNGQPGPGGPGGNNAVSGTAPSYLGAYGQFNLGATPGMDGTIRLNGHGGNEGDAGGGGHGGWWNANGQAGFGGYVHVECYG